MSFTNDLNAAGEDRNLRLDKVVVFRDQVSVLDGGQVLPGFQLSLRALFARADRQAPSGEAGSAPQLF